MQTVLVVEDDDNIRDMLIYALEAAGFAARGYADGGAFLFDLPKASPALVLLDIMLPGEDGMALLRAIRLDTRFQELPVIMLTAKSAEIDRVRGLDGGADDYITKPFSVLEVISRIKAVLRRTSSDKVDTSVVTVGRISVDPARRQVTAAEAEVVLTFKEFELLHYLLLNEGIALSRDRLLEKVWGYDYPGESRTVDMHIKSLRQKLGAEGACIKTVRHVGYKMEAS